MNKNNTTQEERQLAKMVEKLPLDEGDKNLWLERIRNGEMSEELGEEIRGKIGALSDAENEERAQANRARYLAELAMLMKRWRLASQSNNFRRR